MFAITGITGKVGGIAARSLLGAGQSVRAVVRNSINGEAWKSRGCEVALATLNDPAALARALAGSDGVFLLLPPLYDPQPGFSEVKEMLRSICAAIETARPAKVVFLSTVGAHVTEPNLLNVLNLAETALRALPVPVAFLRAAWFMENAAWDLPAARGGLIPSFLQPLDHPIPMVATVDIGSAVARLVQETWTDVRVVELEGPQRYSARDVADGFSRAIGRPVRTEPVPRDTWETLFRAQGTKNPLPRIRMLDGFNEGWIDFEGGHAEAWKGQIPLESVLRELVLASASTDS